MAKFKICCGFLWMAGFVLLTTSGLAQQYQTLGPAAGCGLGQNNCHLKENDWWKNDDHYSTAESFYPPTGKYKSIAQKYGLNPTEAVKVNQSCMTCHGTVISGKANREVDFGVSCESCHGPGSGYKDPHAVQGKGYTDGVKFGMIANKDLNLRAVTCVRCHYITEQKLIDAGHPTGEGFDYVDGITRKVSKHWRTHRAEPAGQLQPAFAKALKARGAAPLAKAPTPTPATGTPSPEARKETPPVPAPVVKKAKSQPVYQDVIEPPSLYKTLGPNSCGTGQQNCHVREYEWWKDDDHYVTYESFLELTGKYAKYVKSYGIDGNQARINQICMKCHGTVISAKPNQEVEFGVSCESCHGPGSDYKDPHSEKPGGYEKALKLGLVENKNLEVRAKTCVRCHYITEQKLVSLTGHSTGENFDYLKGIKKIANTKHWKRAPKLEDLMEATFAKAMQAKGTVQQIVEIAEEPEPAPSNTESLIQPERPPKTIAPAPPAPRPVSPLAMPQNLGPLDLDPFPSVSDTTSLQTLIVILKKRLEYLYQKTGGGY